MRTNIFPLMTLARAALIAAVFVAGSALAQDPIQVALTDASGLPGETVNVSVTFTGNGETSGFGGDFVISDPGAFSNVDLSGCLSGNTSAVGTCVHPGGDPSRVRILLANDEVTPLADFTGTIVFTIDAGADPGLINLAWDNDAWDTAEPEAEVIGTDGSVAVIEGEPPPGPGFSSNPAAGNVSLGVTQIGGALSRQVIITNIGGEDLDVSCSALDDPLGLFGIAPDPVVFQGIAPGASETFQVNCQVPEQGTVTAAMNCDTNDADNPVVDYQFSCSASPVSVPTLNWAGLLLLSLLIFISTWVAFRFVRPV